MDIQCRLFIVFIFSLPQALWAGVNAHQYWVCGVTTYQSLVGGKTQQGQCRANTAYSQPPCREFIVEFAGANGIRPGAPYVKAAGGANIHIEINKVNGHYNYAHTINKAGNQWAYHGKCNYFQAPVGEKIYMDDGLKTQP